MQSMPGKRVWVVIAAYNEASVIARVVADVRRRGFSTVLVDDASTDATAEVAERAGAVIVRHPVNLGQGAALQTGIEFALYKGSDVIVTFDGELDYAFAPMSVTLTISGCTPGCQVSFHWEIDAPYPASSSSRAVKGELYVSWMNRFGSNLYEPT